MNTHLVKLLNKLPLIGFFFYIDMLFVINDSYKLCLLMPQRVLQTCISCIDMFQCLKWTTAKFFFLFPIRLHNRHSFIGFCPLHK